MSLEIALDLVSSLLGLVGSLVLLATAIRATPLQALIDKVGAAKTTEPGYQIAVAVKEYAERNLAKVRLWDPYFMYAGIVLIVGSYSLSLLKDLLSAHLLAL